VISDSPETAYNEQYLVKVLWCTL